MAVKEFSVMCPACRNGIIYMKLDWPKSLLGCTCKRCGAEWVMRTADYEPPHPIDGEEKKRHGN